MTECKAFNVLQLLCSLLHAMPDAGATCVGVETSLLRADKYQGNGRKSMSPRVFIYNYYSFLFISS